MVSMNGSFLRSCRGSFRSSVRDQVPGDDVALDLVGALDDLQHLGVAAVAVDRILVRYARRAEELHRVGGDLPGRNDGQQRGDGGAARGFSATDPRLARGT